MGLGRRLAHLGVGVAALVAVAWVVAGVRDVIRGDAVLGPVASAAPPRSDRNAAPHLAPGSRGRSGNLRFQTLTAAEALAVPGFLSNFGESAIRTPAVHLLGSGGDSAFAYIVLRPFGEKRGEVLNGYRLGRWPAERWLMSRSYFNPDGFVEVTRANASLALSRRFTLGDFVTHDQGAVWPKYVVLEENLIDKLELVLDELERGGVQARRAVVLSGFRAPYYNDRGVGEGMARASRHMFGDAADLILDSDGNGRMDDLTGDGRLTLGDTRPIELAIARVEQRYPELRGGLGTYVATGPRGPFVHIDVRGVSARWESGWWKKGAGKRVSG